MSSRGWHAGCGSVRRKAPLADVATISTRTAPPPHSRGLGLTQNHRRSGAVSRCSAPGGSTDDTHYSWGLCRASGGSTRWPLSPRALPHGAYVMRVHRRVRPSRNLKLFVSSAQGYYRKNRVHFVGFCHLRGTFCVHALIFLACLSPSSVPSHVIAPSVEKQARSGVGVRRGKVTHKMGWIGAATNF